MLEAGGTELPVAIVENRRATRLTLRIVPGGQSLRLTVPPHVSDRQIDDFLLRNSHWASTRIARLPKPVEVVDGARIAFLGTPHRIVRIEALRGIVEPAELDGEPVLKIPGPAATLARRLRTYFQKEARARLNIAVSRYARALDVRPRAIRITDTASRWGSCSSTRTLSFSWRIVMAPVEVLDYLAAHETAHLRHMNHGPHFWQLVRELCPQMDSQKEWLRRHGARLHAVRFD
jgi:predicted metal-dependent hydrolase